MNHHDKNTYYREENKQVELGDKRLVATRKKAEEKREIGISGQDKQIISKI